MMGILKLIDGWQRKNLRCYFCNSTQSVKYQTEVYDPVLASGPSTVCICNKCALRHISHETKNNKA